MGERAQPETTVSGIGSLCALECVKVPRFAASDSKGDFLMADFAKILATLRQEEKQLAKRAVQIRKAIEALSEVPIPLGRPKGAKKAAKKRTRKKMSPAARKAMSKRMKKMWAEKKKAAKKKPTKKKSTKS